MPTTMMYPTQSSSIMRAKPAHKNGSGSQHPQWMRTLEEKYQKLHKKIIENTTMVNLKFSHSRSFHDFRTLNSTRYRDSNMGKTNTKANINRSHTSVHIENMNKNIERKNSMVDQNGNCLQNSQSNLNVIETEQTFNKMDLNGPTETGNEQQGVMETQDKQSESSESVYENRSEEGLTFQCMSDSKNRVVINSPCDEDTKIIQNEEEVEIKDERDLKTALSRASRKTAKSCPAQIQARSYLRHRPTTQSSVQRSKSAHKSSDMFNKMSKEAHHAIKETVKEMNASRSQTCLTSDFTAIKNQVQFNPSRQRKSVRSWVQPKRSSNKPSSSFGYNATQVLQGASDRMQQMLDSNADFHNETDSNSSENQSHHSSHGSGIDAARKNSSKLPDIQNDYSKDKFTTKGQLFRLPGIGKYDIPVLQDNLFEITPPGFDSRYKDLEPVAERESETPPPNIRQHAIEKCSEWLSKYSS